MSSSVLQATSNASSSAVTSIAKAFASNITAGSSLMAVVTWGGTGTATCAGSRNGSLTQKGSTLYNATDGESSALFILDGAVAGSETLTGTFPSSSFDNIAIFEIGDTSGYDTSTGQYQPTPGSGANAVTSGNVTPTVQPGLMVAVGQNVHNGATVAAGTSLAFTDLGSAGTTGIIVAEAESYRYTSTSAVAGTFTLGGTNPALANTITFAALFKEGVVSGSGAIAEGSDAASGAGSGGASVSGSGAIAEAHDTVAGHGAIAGAGTVAEGYDVVSGVGLSGTRVVGSGAMVEGADSVSGADTINFSMLRPVTKTVYLSTRYVPALAYHVTLLAVGGDAFPRVIPPPVSTTVRTRR